MKTTLALLLVLGTNFALAQSSAYELGHAESALPEVVICGKIHKVEVDPNGSSDLVLNLKNVRTGFLGDKLVKLKAERKLIHFTGSDNQAKQRKSMLFKTRLLGEQMMNKQVCVSSEYVSNIDSSEIVNHVTSAIKLEDALVELDILRGTNTGL